MVEKPNNLPDNLKQKNAEIYAEICKIIDGRRSVDELIKVRVRYRPS